MNTKMKKKIMTGIITLSLILTMMPMYSYATEITEDNNAISAENIRLETISTAGNLAKDFELSALLKEIGTAEYKNVLKYNNGKTSLTQPLYPTFSSQTDAMRNAKEVLSPVLEEMQELYSMPAFSNITWKQYLGYLPDYEDYVYGNKAKEEMVSTLYSFIDIYENVESNEFIMERIDLLNEAGNMSFDRDSAIKEVLLSLPMDSCEAIIDTGLEIRSEPDAQINAYSTTKAVNYATIYATEANQNYYYYSGADCTNFTSQIKYVGGTPMEYSANDSEYVGWWAKTNIYGAKVCSRKWKLASLFANYFGVSYRVKSFKTFSDKVVKGSYIGYDKENDGDCNNMGFVTATSTNLKKTNGVTYYDFKIAQHTGDYHRWVSHANNHWEEKQSDKNRFIIIN